MDILEQLMKIDPVAADMVAVLRASADSYPADEQATLATDGMRGVARGKLSAALKDGKRDVETITALCHDFSLAVWGYTSSSDWTQAQAKATANGVSGSDNAKVAERIVASVGSLKGEQAAEDFLAEYGQESAAKETPRPVTTENALAGIKTISVTYERKFNLGNYNSLHIGMTTWADVPDDVTAGAVETELWEWVKDAVKAQALPVIKKEAKPIATTTPPPKASPPPAAPSKPPSPHTTSAPPPPGTGTPPSPVAAPPAANTEGGVYQTETVKITAPSGKPVVEFWKPGRQYAEIRHHLGGEALMKLCPALAGAGWVAAHFDDIGKVYSLPLTITWTPSPKNAKWQDIVSIALR